MFKYKSEIECPRPHAGSGVGIGHNMAHANVNKGKKRTNICGHCQVRVNEGICCDCCGFWVHYKCEGLSEEEARVWNRMGSRAKFYCSVRNCEQIAEHFINIVGPLKEQVDRNTKRIDELEEKMITYENKGTCDAVSEVTKAWESKKEELKDEMKDELQTVLQSERDMQQARNPQKENLQAEVKVALEEEKDKEYRARNLIMMGIPEPDTDDMAIGKAGDLDYVTKVFSRHMKVDESQYKITDTTRLHGGKRDRDHATDPRPLRVRFDRADMVSRIAREARQLNECEEQEIRKITIFRDRTKKERDERRELNREAWGKNVDESDETYKWIVDYERMQVIRVSKDYRTQRPFRQRKYR